MGYKLARGEVAAAVHSMDGRARRVRDHYRASASADLGDVAADDGFELDSQRLM